jgi:hypothetical protein
MSTFRLRPRSIGTLFFVEESEQRVWRRIAAALQRHPRGEHALRIEARIDGADIHERLEQQAGADEQDHAQRNLAHDERSPEPRRLPAARRPRAIVLERVNQVAARERDRRRQAEQHAVDDGDDEHHQQHRRVDPNIVLDRIAGRREGEQ